MSSTGTSRRCAAIAASPPASTSHRARRRNFPAGRRATALTAGDLVQQVRADRVSGLEPRDAVVPRHVQQDTQPGEARLLVLDSRSGRAATSSSSTLAFSAADRVSSADLLSLTCVPAGPLAPEFHRTGA